MGNAHLSFFPQLVSSSRTSQPVARRCAGRWVRWRKRCRWWRSWRGTWQESLRRSSWHPTRPPQTMQKRWRFRCHVKSRVIPRLTVGPGGADACVKTCRYGKSVPTQPSTERNRTAPDQPRCPDSISTSNGLKI